ncbi:hypothetical protein VCSRO147_2581 [Vibrio cholerae]|nr:Uncharacterised protein [Vibrio paracholerae]GHW10372.1 hypothetical protein VCSRO149_1532 [Vibrio cholerae]GHW13553.1 hypothetical protein VCSRO192_2561 [Vibrio cholerae]GHX26899.1 hypothetical protein VCSRO107_2740 [Vibrio cholerae]GHX38621.1 hypothetical protein VCSRO62_2826 [Vibrio cholerae]
MTRKRKNHSPDFKANVSSDVMDVPSSVQVPLIYA